MLYGNLTILTCNWPLPIKKSSTHLSGFTKHVSSAMNLVYRLTSHQCIVGIGISWCLFFLHNGIAGETKQGCHPQALLGDKIAEQSSEFHFNPPIKRRIVMELNTSPPASYTLLLPAQQTFTTRLISNRDDLRHSTVSPRQVHGLRGYCSSAGLLQTG